MVVVVKISPREVINVTYVGEKQVQYSRSVLSPDGKAIMSDVHGVDPQGKAFETTQVLERQ